MLTFTKQKGSYQFFHSRNLLSLSQMNRTFHSLWDTLLSEMIEEARVILYFSTQNYVTDHCILQISSEDKDDDSIDSWSSTDEPVEFYPHYDIIDRDGDVTACPNTLINEQSFSHASPVEHHPTASDEATCTTALQSTHKTNQHTTCERCFVFCIIMQSAWCIHVNTVSL